MIILEKWYVFLNNLTIEEVFISLITPLYHSLPRKAWGYFPRGTRIRVWFQHTCVLNWSERQSHCTISKNNIKTWDININWIQQGKNKVIFESFLLKMESHKTSGILHSTNQDNYANHIHKIKSVNNITRTPYPGPIDTCKREFWRGKTPYGKSK